MIKAMVYIYKHMTKIGGRVLALAMCLLCTAGWAQDIILKKNGEEIVGRVVQVSADTLLYRHFSDTGGIAYAMPRQEVAQVKLMDSSLPLDAPELRYKTEVSSTENHRLLALQAKLDAKNYYRAKGVFWTTMGSTIIHPAAGLATGAVISAVRPSTESDHNPNRYMMKEPVYRAAYEKQAHRRKAGKAAAGFGVGAAVLGVISLVALGGI